MKTNVTPFDQLAEELRLSTKLVRACVASGDPRLLATIHVPPLRSSSYPGDSGGLTEVWKTLDADEHGERVWVVSNIILSGVQAPLDLHNLCFKVGKPGADWYIHPLRSPLWLPQRLEVIPPRQSFGVAIINEHPQPWRICTSECVLKLFGWELRERDLV